MAQLEHDIEVESIVDLMSLWFDGVTTGPRPELESAIKTVRAALRLSFACGDLGKWPPELRVRYTEFAAYYADFNALQYRRPQKEGLNT